MLMRSPTPNLPPLQPVFTSQQAALCCLSRLPRWPWEQRPRLSVLVQLLIGDSRFLPLPPFSPAFLPPASLLPGVFVTQIPACQPFRFASLPCPAGSVRLPRGYQAMTEM